LTMTDGQEPDLAGEQASSNGDEAAVDADV
jgi:hypothetical protein